MYIGVTFRKKKRTRNMIYLVLSDSKIKFSVWLLVKSNKQTRKKIKEEKN